MLTRKQNLIETIRGGKPDRYVKCFEPFAMLRSPYAVKNARPVKGGPAVVNQWGVTQVWPEGTPGAFPVHDPEHIVCKDITRWREYVHAPNVIFDDSEWKEYVAEAAEIDRDEYFATALVAPGIFEQCHYLLEIQNCLISFYEEPEAMHELIDYIADWEIQYAEQLCLHLKPDALFHHDDWGSQISTFLSPAMFEEFFVPAYQKVYGYYKEHGVEVIVHHSDSYAATLVPYMIDMGVDIWQGVMNSNNIPALIEKYGGQITFMGGIDSASVDFEGWTPEIVAKEVRKACDTCGTRYFIPCTSQGGPMSTFSGVYEACCKEIDNMSREKFGQ